MSLLKPYVSNDLNCTERKPTYNFFIEKDNTKKKKKLHSSTFRVLEVE